MSRGRKRLARPLGSRTGSWLSLVLLPASILAQVTQPDPNSISAGQSLSADQRANEPFTYEFIAAAGTDYLLEVAQEGLDFTVTVEGPDGLARTFNSPLFRDEPEWVLLESLSAGRYRITIESTEHTGAQGSYTLSVTVAEESATSAGSTDAWRLMTQAGELNYAGGEQAWGDAVERYEAAAEIWRTLDRREELAQSLFSVATIEYWQRGNWNRAVALAEEAASIYAGLEREALAANARHLEAAALVESAGEIRADAGGNIALKARSLYSEALELLESVRATHEHLGNTHDLALTLNNIGYTYQFIGEFSAARPYYEQAAALARASDEWEAELNPLANLATIEAEEGTVASGISVLQRLLDLLPADASPRYRADQLDNLAAMHRRFGDIDAALQRFSEALDLHEQIDDLKGQGRSLWGLGHTYFSSGEFELAVDYLERAIPLVQNANDGQSLARIWEILGNVAYLEGDYASALQRHEESLSMTQSRSGLSDLEVWIARDLVAIGRYEDAADSAARALDIANSIESNVRRAAALHELGRARIALDENLAIADLEAASALYESLRLDVQAADSLNTLSLAYLAAEKLDEAIVSGARALDLAEGLRGRVADPELRAFYSALRESYYDTQINALMRSYDADPSSSEERLEEAFAVSERSRAALTADLLWEASIQLESDADDNLSAQRQSLYDQLADVTLQRSTLLGRVTLRPESATLLRELEASLITIENELNLVEIALRRTNPHFDDFRTQDPLTLPQVQQELDSRSALIQYALGAERSFVWIVTAETVRAFEIANRTVIESLARDAITAISEYGNREVPRAALYDSLFALSRAVLDPLDLQTLRKDRLLIAADGALQYVPFSAMARDSGDGSLQYLIGDFEVVSIPSISILAAHRAARPEVRHFEESGRLMAIFADPVFNADDPRIARSPVVAPPQNNDVTLSMRAWDGERLERLPATAYEASEIVKLVSDDSVFVATGTAASRTAVLTQDLEQYRFIHFATHGLVDSRYPALSSLALAQFDDTGRAQNGFLRLHDIFSLRLNADLVVLSACDTALGRDIRGEGLLGLTQGFLYAGAKALIVSLWKVDDRATAELVTRFYAGLLNEGLEASTALRQAQQSLAAESRWRDPFFWGGFVLVGDWR